MKAILRLTFLVWALALGLSGCGSDPPKYVEEEPGPSTGGDGGADGGADSDIDSDADTDADADTDVDGDADGDADTCSSNVTCSVDTDCGGAPAGCVCPQVLDGQELTSYCYPSCTAGACGSGFECVTGVQNASCLRSGTFSLAWKGKFVPSSITQPTLQDLTTVNVPFQLGSISLTFYLSACIELNQTGMGHVMGITYMTGQTGAAWILEILVPYAYWQNGQDIDFRQCLNDGQFCHAFLIEQQGTTTSFMRAMSYVPASGGQENLVHINTATTTRYQQADGTLQLLLVEYSAQM